MNRYAILYKLTSTLLLVIGVSCIAPLYSQVKINEICASNDSILLDQYGNSSDWIELYNDRPFDISLNDLFISDADDDLQKFPLPNKTIPANSFIVIFASDENSIEGEIHTNFKLNKDGETLFLSDKEGILLDKIYYPSLKTDESYGRKVDGQDPWVFFSEPTPSKPNSTTTSYVPAEQPSSSHESGFYNQNITVLYTAKSSGDILRYTLDASPVNIYSPILDKPLEINKTTNVRVRAFKQGIGGKELNQIFFYDVEHVLPIVHLSTDPDNLYDYENGILVKGPDAEEEKPYLGANFWKDIEIPIHFDYFIDKTLIRSYGLGAKIHGGKASRSNNMQSLRLMADKEWGDERMNYPFFDETYERDYKRLVLRNASGDYHYTHFRDGYMARYFAKEKLDLDLIQFQPVVVYINGEYYGQLHLREKIDKHYISTHYDLPSEAIDLLEKDSQIVEGDFQLFNEHVAFLLNEDLSKDENFAVVEQHFDVDHFIDYVTCQSVVNNTDWPRNNIKYWREKDGGKWRYFLFDMDVSMGRYEWTKADKNYLGEWVDTLSNARFYDMLLALWENENYKERFVTRYADLLNTTFRSENWLLETENTVKKLEPELRRQFIHWESEARYTWWKDVAIPELYEFTEKREDYARQFLQQRFDLSDPIDIDVSVDPPSAGKVYVNTILPDYFPWNGKYFEDYSVRFQAKSTPGFKFSHWEINQMPNVLTDKEISVLLKDGAEIKAVFTGSFPGMKVELSPNPGRNNTAVRFNNPFNGKVLARIYSANGKEYYQKAFDFLHAGDQTIKLHHNITIPGIYFLELRSGTEISTTKLILL